MRPPVPSPDTFQLPPWLPPLFYLLLACLFLWRSTFTGEVFLPARMLQHVAPWGSSDQIPPWNPLRWDGIAQFYPWRLFAAQTVHAGALPLWNPYQLCGTPFVANSQSAPFYPGNLFFYLIPTAQAFGVEALLHLTLCGWFMYLLLRQIRCSPGAALLGGVVYAFSAWQVAWLQLPTFLATSCWFPLLLREVHRTKGWGIGFAVGMMLLAGHLQIAFYGLLAGTLWALGLMVVRGREKGIAESGRLLAHSAVGLGLGMMLVAPQLLPTLELSRISHRAGQTVNADSFRTYSEYALPMEGLTQLTLPDFFGGDTDPNNPYWGFYMMSRSGETQAVRHNAAETALYVGILPLLLGGLALQRGLNRGALDKRALFFSGLALLTLLMALGTPLNALFYFGIPGFGQSGSPARSLVLWVFSLSALSAFGLDALRRSTPTRRELAIAAGVLAFLFAIGLSQAARALGTTQNGFAALKVPTLGEAFGRIGEDWLRLLLLALTGMALFLPLTQRRLGRRTGSSAQTAAVRRDGPFAFLARPEGWDLRTLSALLLIVLDLFAAGIRVSPTAPPEKVYPLTPGIQMLQKETGHERIFPVNKYWSLYKSPHAVLPPNAATVYGLRDVQGYDSLLTGQIKTYANAFARTDPFGKDASPPEVGNMVFFQDPNLPIVPQTSALFALTPADARDPAAIPPGEPLALDDPGMKIYPLKGSIPRASLILENGSKGTVTWREDSPTRVSLETEETSEGELRLNDAFYPGWRVRVDGKPGEITRQAEIPVFRAVATPEGKHQIQFRYEPDSFRVGLYFALLACGLLLGWRVALGRQAGQQPSANRMLTRS